jgi:hypothetical protein
MDIPGFNIAQGLEANSIVSIEEEKSNGGNYWMESNVTLPA